MSDSESAGFLLARGCFVLAAVTFIAFCLYWLYASKVSFGTTAILSVCIGICGVPGLALSLWWVRSTEISLSSQLYPDDLPFPFLPNNQKIPDNAVIVYFGSNISWGTKFPLTILAFNKEPMIVVDRPKNKDALVITTLKIFDDRNNIIARIDEDGPWIDPSARKKRPNKSTLLVFDHNDKEVLNIKFINERAIQIEGIFRNSEIQRPVIITNDYMQVNNGKVMGNVFANITTAIQLNAPNKH